MAKVGHAKKAIEYPLTALRTPVICHAYFVHFQHRHKFGRVLLLVIVAHSAEIVFGRNKPVEKAQRRDDSLVEAAG
ncbi:hypothetical protein [Rhizobium skierniewicense]|uniref:hypothetical protein n=1 Tax=Rhizobium skierniewicense TaxID=984260 RepID=UPI0015728612|nr:hypothetical protein [Rhizobium skierniewicense]NTF31987.1 hypothetical protein [Rhizobium skierniewicense]